jgi:tetratricopeptide (TPR) repeat protein
MADLQTVLSRLDSDPDDPHVLAGLAAITEAARAGLDVAGAAAVAHLRKRCRDRGRPDVALKLFDAELAGTTGPRVADLLIAKAELLDEDLLDPRAAEACYQAALSVRPDAAAATEALESIALARDNWQKFAAKYVDEAKASTDRELTTALYLSAAETYARYAPEAPEVEAHLRASLAADPRNAKAGAHLQRLLARAGRWAELAETLAARVDHAATSEERVPAILALAEVTRGPLAQPERALELYKKVVAIDPAQPSALRVLGDALAAGENWQALVTLYGAALRARGGDGDLGMLLQVGMILWKRLADLEAAEDYFRRIRKLDAAHPVALDFYRAYHGGRGEGGKLVAILRQAEKALPVGAADTDGRAKALAVEIAELSEHQLGTPDKAIDAWKQLLRTDPTSTEARAALRRLYRKAEKWNPLLDLIKDEIERLPEAEVAGKIAGLYEVVAIYADKLRLDPMVLNTYNAILRLDPGDLRAIDELAGKYRAMGRWQDLIGILAKKAELEALPVADRAAILRESAELWIERFGNYAQAIRPLERLLELDRNDADAVARLKDIYTRRRQWRQLITLLGHEAEALTGADRRAKQNEMARLAAERVGDTRLAIEIHCRTLAEAGPGIGRAGDGQDETYAALAGLYEREKRYLALAEILGRQRVRAATTAEAVALLEKQGALLADRIGAPALAAEAFAAILAIEPHHAKALRTLRELYAAAADWERLEALYLGLGQSDELVDALVALADRQDDRELRLALVRRAARVASERQEPERAARVWERLLAIEPTDATAARALVPVYQKADKPAKLLPVYEVLLGHCTTTAERLAQIAEIRALCEQRLGSRALALSWTARAFELAPDEPALVGELLRLAQGPEHWRDVVAVLERHADADARPVETRLALLRALAGVYRDKLDDDAAARGAHQRILALAPGDRDAEAAIEALSEELSDWPGLLASYRRQLERAAPEARRGLFAKIAQVEEERLADLDAAAATHGQVLAEAPTDAAALAALARLHEARGDWDGLATVLTTQLAVAAPEARAALELRLATLEDGALDRPTAALPHYRGALAALAPPPATLLAACVRYLPGGARASAIDDDTRRALARELRPHLDAAGDPAARLAALGCLASDPAAAPAVARALDREMVPLFHALGRAEEAWAPALRVVADAPGDVDARGALIDLAEELGRPRELAAALSDALTALRKSGAPTVEVLAMAQGLARRVAADPATAAGAERAWLTVLEIAADDAEAYGALAALYRKDARWPDLRALLERQIEVAVEPAAKLVALGELTTLDEDVLGDPSQAVADYRRILELEPGHLPAYRALERLYADGESWADLEAVLAAEAAWVPEAAQAGLRFRRAELRARRLGDRVGAVDLLEEVVAAHPSHADARELLEEQLGQPELRQRVAAILEPLYQRDHLWRDLVGVLRIQREAVSGPEAAALLGRIAGLEERELDHGKAAFETWAQALSADPGAPAPSQALLRLAATYDRWHDAAAAFERAADVAGDDVAVAAPLRAHVAEICDRSLGDNPRAIAAYRALVALDPSDVERAGPALAALARLHEEEEQWRELREVVARQADLDGAGRLGFLARAAELDETRLGDPDRAIATWREVAADDPANAGAIAALERLYQARDRWADLAELVRLKIDLADEPAIKIGELRRLAEIHEVMLAAPGEAIVAYLEILDLAADDVAALDELARLYREANRPLDRLDILERRLAVADDRADADRVARRAELAGLLAELRRGPEALERWAEILVLDPEHAAATAAVRAGFDDPELAPRAGAILEPLYEATGRDRELAELLTIAAERESSARERVRLWSRVATIHEGRLSDRPAALTAAVAALRAAVAEPELPETIAVVDRLAGELEREVELIAIYRDVADDVLDSGVQRRLYLDIADLAQAAVGDLELACTYYQRVLEVAPDDVRALGALERIYRERLRGGRTADAAPLYEILARKADLAGADVAARTAALAEMAELAAGPLARPDDAIAAWEQVLEALPAHPQAATALDAMYRRERRWRDLVDLYERRLGFVDTLDEAIALRVKLGELHEHELGDVTTAIESYAAALGGDPGHAGAIAALERLLANPDGRAAAAEVLEPVYISRHDWARLARLYEINLDGTAEPDARVDLIRRIARLHEEQLEDLDAAARWYARQLAEDPADPHVRDQLHRLASVGGDWAGLAATYQQVLDADSGDAAHLRDLAVAAATIYDRRLDDPVRGGAAYRRALTAPAPAVDDRLELLARAEALFARHQAWPALIGLYDDAVAAADTDDVLRRDLYARKAAILEERTADPAGAIDAWRAVLELADGLAARLDYARAADHLDRLYRVTGRWHDLAELGADRIERATDERDEIDRRLAQADVLERHLHDLDGALDQYEEILTTASPDRALPALERLAAGAAARERTLGLLEPVYRARNWWQKLVVVLDAKLEFVRDPVEQVETLTEIAAIHESRGGDLGMALDALARAWRLEPTRHDVFERLLALGSRMGAWDELCATLAAGAAATMDPPTQELALARLAELQETQRGDHPAAIAAWRQVLEVSPDDPLALSALDRLLALEARSEELVAVVARRAALADDAKVRLVLLHRIAALHDQVLERPADAIVAYREVLAEAPEDEVALVALERLYRASGDGRELASVLEQRLALADDADAQRALRLDLAAVYERELRDPFAAIAHLEATLAADAGDATALAELDRLYADGRMWPELQDVLDRRALLATDAGARAELAYRAARLTEVELGEVEVAVGRYGAVLQIAPGHAGARAALDALLAGDDHAEAAAALLERHLRAAGDADGLVRVAERRLELPADREARRAQWAALADLHETLRSDLRAAAQTWARALHEDPTDTALLGPLERLAQVRGSWAEHAALLEGQLAGGRLDAELEHGYAMRLGKVYEEALGDLARAATSYRRAATTNVDEVAALAALDRVLWRQNRWGELAEVLAREAELAESDAVAADLLFRLGDVRESQLRDLAGAVEAYRSVIERAPRHGAARASLERLLAVAESERGAIIDTLEPLYEAEGDWGRLADLLAAKLAVTDDRHERAAIYQRIAGLAESRLGDGVRALDAAGGWLAEDPAASEALAEVDRLAALQGRWVEAAARVAGVAGALDDAGALPLWMYVGTIQLDRIGDAAAAAASFDRALAIDDEHGPALEGLERIHRSRGQVAPLAEVLARRAGLAFDPPTKQALWTEVATLRERVGDDPGAIAAWEAVIDLADDDRMPLARLAAIHERRGDLRALVTTLGRAARIAGDAGEEKRLRVRIAELEGQLGDLGAAAAAWQGVLDLDPDDLGALAALEELHTRGKDWMAVQDVLTRRLELARSSSDKTAVLAKMARLAERERGALDDAIGHWYAALDVDNAQLAAYGELERLLAKAERWHDLVELLDRRAELHGTLGDNDAEIAALARAADIWEGPLDNPDAAGELLEKVLRREPGSVAALTRLARIYERASDWDKCGEVLAKALALGPKGTDAADLFFRLGEVADKAQGDRATAAAHYRQALTHDPRHAGAIAALERQAKDDGNWAVVADMLKRRIAIGEDRGDDVLPLALEYAAAEQRLGTPAAALAVLERVAAAAPGEVRVLTLLGDLYFAAGRLDEAAPIYDRLAEDAKAARRMKDVARYRQRQGGILEARGDVAGAVAAYEEAFRVNPTDVPTMAGLGRLALAQRDWEKARRVYRSLVLQNLDADAGLTKADVYYALGVIHVELGEAPKAKGMFQRGLEIDPKDQRLKDALAGLDQRPA